MDKHIYIIVGIFLLIYFFFVLGKGQKRKLLKTITKPYRGTRSERALVLMLLKYGIPARAIFHDLYVKKLNGSFSQIDLVVATRAGIFVFEVKDYSGWIYGDGDQSYWTQVLAYGKSKYRLYNPIMQNATHVRELRKRLKLTKNVPFYSIVVFYGDCVLKNISYVPVGSFIVKPRGVFALLNNIVNNSRLTYYSDEDGIIKILNEAVQNGENIETQIQHMDNINKMFGRSRV
jgi:Nuclease-related domain.